MGTINNNFRNFSLYVVIIIFGGYIGLALFVINQVSWPNVALFAISTIAILFVIHNFFSALEENSRREIAENNEKQRAQTAQDNANNIAEINKIKAYTEFVQALPKISLTKDDINAILDKIAEKSETNNKGKNSPNPPQSPEVKDNQNDNVASQSENEQKHPR